jgi:hypothetical protein
MVLHAYLLEEKFEGYNRKIVYVGRGKRGERAERKRGERGEFEE